MDETENRDQQLMADFAQIAAAVVDTMLRHSRQDDPIHYGKLERMVAAGEATLQIRVNLSLRGDEIATRLVVLDLADEPLAVLGGVVARGGVPQ